MDTMLLGGCNKGGCIVVWEHRLWTHKLYTLIKKSMPYVLTFLLHFGKVNNDLSRLLEYSKFCCLFL
jgi:hypothetical protein